MSKFNPAVARIHDDLLDALAQEVVEIVRREAFIYKATDTIEAVLPTIDPGREVRTFSKKVTVRLDGPIDRIAAEREDALGKMIEPIYFNMVEHLLPYVDMALIANLTPYNACLPNSIAEFTWQALFPLHWPEPRPVIKVIPTKVLVSHLLVKNGMVFVASDCWDAIVGSCLDIGEDFCPVTKYAAVVQGHLGYFRTSPIYTDAYRHPTYKVLKQGTIIHVPFDAFSCTELVYEIEDNVVTFSFSYVRNDNRIKHFQWAK